MLLLGRTYLSVKLNISRALMKTVKCVMLSETILLRTTYYL